MTKTATIIISILLMASGIIIKILNSAQNHNELIGFFAGFVFGIGIVVFFQSIFAKKKTA